MKEDPEESAPKKIPKKCVVFEPQAWRPKLCKNCFKTRDEHNAAAASPASPALGRAATTAAQEATCSISDSEDERPRRIKLKKFRGGGKADDSPESPVTSTPPSSAEISREAQLLPLPVEGVAAADTGAAGEPPLSPLAAAEPAVADLSERRSVALPTDRAAAAAAEDFLATDAGLATAATASTAGELNAETPPPAPKIEQSANGAGVKQAAGAILDHYVTERQEAPVASDFFSGGSEAETKPSVDSPSDSATFNNNSSNGGHHQHSRQRQFYDSATSSDDDASVEAERVTSRVFTRQNANMSASGGGDSEGVRYTVCAKEIGDASDSDSGWARSRSHINGDYSPYSVEDSRLEGQRLLVETLREKLVTKEEKIDAIERQKKSLTDLLALRKDEYGKFENELTNELDEINKRCRKLEAENKRLLEKIKLPESDRLIFKDQENQVTELRFNLEESDCRIQELSEDNESLRHEIKDLHLEMDELHDQFREDEAIEFRELQKELEATAKNCRILQFKLRKSERRFEQVDTKCNQYEEKIKQLEQNFDTKDEKLNRIRNLEDELQMAKEMDKLRSSAPGSDVTSVHDTHKPKLGDIGRKSSSERDVAQLMRDLSDALERENDVKEQLKYAEGDLQVVRRKLGQLEDENETLNVQLHKFTQAKTFRDTADAKPSTEEAKVQLDMAEEEVRVLRRRLVDMEDENQKLLEQLKQIQEGFKAELRPRMESDSSDVNEEQLLVMAQDIECLKNRLVEKDQEIASLLTDGSKSKPKLTRPKSFDEDDRSKKENIERTKAMDSEFAVDIRHQMQIIQNEAGLLKERLMLLQKDNVRLTEENMKILKHAESHNKNDQLQDRINRLEDENSSLRSQQKRSAENRLSNGLVVADDLRDKVKTLETEAERLSKEVQSLESHNTELHAKLDAAYVISSRERRSDRKLDVDSATPRELRRHVKELEDSLNDLEKSAESVDAEKNHMKTELARYKNDYSGMVTTFKQRQHEMKEEIAGLENKNGILGNLLDLVSERAEATQRELEARAGAKEEIVDNQNSLLTRLTHLERSLAEERAALQLAQNSRGRNDEPQTDEEKLQEKELDIVKQELKLCQRQIEDSSAKVKDLKEKVAKEQEASESAKAEATKALKELEEEKKKREDAAAKSKKKDAEADKSEKSEKSSAGAKGGKEPATWRWEKQDLEKKVRDLTKKLDDMDRELKSKQFKMKISSDEPEKKPASKNGNGGSGGDSSKELKKVKEECDQFKSQVDELNTEVTKVKDAAKKREGKLLDEKKLVESTKKALEKEITSKEDIIEQKDNIIRQKSALIKQKEDLLAEREAQLRAKDNQLDVKTKEMQLKLEEAKHSTADVDKLNDVLIDKDNRLKNMDDAIRLRDERLVEKDVMLESLNQRLCDRDSEVKDMDSGIREAMRKLDNRESDNRVLREQLQEAKHIADDLGASVGRLEERLQRSEHSGKRELEELVMAKGKLEAQVVELESVRISLQEEVRLLKEALEQREIGIREERERHERDMKLLNDKLNSLEQAKVSKGEIVAALNREKENLLGDRKKLTDEISFLRKEIYESTSAWNVERDELQKILKEKNKMVEDSSDISERMGADIRLAKAQISQLNEEKMKVEKDFLSLRGRFDEVKQERLRDAEAWSNKRVDLLKQIENKEAIFNAEKAGLEDLWQNKVKSLSMQVEQATRELNAARDDNKSQRNLMEESQRSTTELKVGFDERAQAWDDLRKELEDRLQEAEAKNKSVFEMQRGLNEAREQLAQEQNRITEIQNTLTCERAEWESKKAELNSKLKLAQDTANSASGAKIKELKGRMFQGDNKDKREAILEKELEQQRKHVTEAQDISKDLQSQLKEAEQLRQKDQRDLMVKMEDERKLWDQERRDIEQRNKQLEKRSLDINSLQKELLEIQYAVKEERHMWEKERTDMRQQYQDANRLRLAEKEKLGALLAEVHKLRTIIPLLERQQNLQDQEMIRRRPDVVKRSVSSQDQQRHTSTAHIELGSQSIAKHTPSTHDGYDSSNEYSSQPPGIQYAKEALQRISQLVAAESSNGGLYAKDLNLERFIPQEAEHPASPTTDDVTKLAAPNQNLSFRRSLSTSEVEALQNYDFTSAARCAEPPLSPRLPAPTPVVISGDDNGLVDASRSSRCDVMDRSGRARGPTRRAMSVATSRDTKEPEIPFIDEQIMPLSHMVRPPTYKSGTRSAYSSRDASPMRMHRRHNYPLPPPSMIISRSGSKSNIGSQASLYSSQETLMAALYEKLRTIERESREDLRFAAETLMRERGPRLLNKSMSVDYEVLETQAPIHPDYEEMFRFDKQHSAVYADAPLSQTLPACLRFGELVITPGIEKLSKTLRQDVPADSSRRSSGVKSPTILRKQFYDKYDELVRRPLVKRKSTLRKAGSSQSEAGKEEEESDDASSVVLQRRGSLDERKRRSLAKTVSSFLGSMKDTRQRLFKRAPSVEKSSKAPTALQESIARIGVETLSQPGAPSNLPSGVDFRRQKSTSSSTQEDKERKRKHRRSASIDLPFRFFSKMKDAKAKDSDVTSAQGSSSSSVREPPSPASSSKDAPTVSIQLREATSPITSSAMTSQPPPQRPSVSQQHVVRTVPIQVHKGYSSSKEAPARPAAAVTRDIPIKVVTKQKEEKTLPGTKQTPEPVSTSYSTGKKTTPRSRTPTRRRTPTTTNAKEAQSSKPTVSKETRKAESVLEKKAATGKINKPSVLIKEEKFKPITVLRMNFNQASK